MASRVSRSEPTRYNNEQLRIVMVGKTGSGKSASGNTILGGKPFESRFSAVSLTQRCSKASAVVDGKQIAVIDSPGLFDTSKTAETTAAEVSRSIAYASPGPHVFLIVIQLGRFTEEERKSVQMIQKLFGEEADRHSMVLFTHGDLLRGEPVEEFLKESKDLQELVSKCYGQYHVFNNQLEDPSQVSELLSKISAITERNRGSHYTSEMFQKAEKEIEKEKQRILEEKEKEMLKQYKGVTMELRKRFKGINPGATEKQLMDREEEEKIRELREEMEKEARQEAENSDNVLQWIGGFVAVLVRLIEIFYQS